MMHSLWNKRVNVECLWGLCLCDHKGLAAQLRPWGVPRGLFAACEAVAL